MKAHDHHEGERCGPNCPPTNAQLSPVAVRWATLTTVTLVTLLLMPYSWVLHIVRAAATLGVLAVAGGFVACVVIVAVRATGASKQHR